MATKVDNIDSSQEEELPNFSIKFDFETKRENEPAAKKRFLDTTAADRDKLLAESHARTTRYNMKWAVSVFNGKLVREKSLFYTKLNYGTTSTSTCFIKSV